MLRGFLVLSHRLRKWDHVGNVLITMKPRSPDSGIMENTSKPLIGGSVSLRGPTVFSGGTCLSV